MWMNCPASVTLAEGRTRPSSLYAKEGTAAHSIAELILSGELFPPDRITVEGSEFIVGLPMLRALNPYVDFIQKLQDQTVDVWIEKRVGLDGGVVWGTTDCVAKAGRVLHIVDLKYGKGVPVDPDHAQFKIYALASVHTLWPQDYSLLDEVNLTVIQPRINPIPQTCKMSFDDLLGWGVVELQPAMKRIQQGDTTEKYGHWCRWCVRKGDCNAYKNHKNVQASAVFDDAP
jgi:hypothetical protein